MSTVFLDGNVYLHNLLYMHGFDTTNQNESITIAFISNEYTFIHKLEHIK